jgi:membrane-associated HD superfamily phosphohydrolase
LHTISNSFVETLKTTYHPRIRYPEIKLQAGADVLTQPTKTP